MRRTGKIKYSKIAEKKIKMYKIKPSCNRHKKERHEEVQQFVKCNQP